LGSSAHPRSPYPLFLFLSSSHHHCQEFELKAQTVYEISLASMLVLIIVCALEAVIAAQSNRGTLIGRLLTYCCREPSKAQQEEQEKPPPPPAVPGSPSFVRVGPPRDANDLSLSATRRLESRPSALRRSEPPVSQMLADDSDSNL
jgi:hypothetical protein